jgi:hypothetical protein
MWEPLRLTTLWASTASYRDSVTFAFTRGWGHVMSTEALPTKGCIYRAVPTELPSLLASQFGSQLIYDNILNIIPVMSLWHNEGSFGTSELQGAQSNYCNEETQSAQRVTRLFCKH